MKKYIVLIMFLAGFYANAWAQNVIFKGQFTKADGKNMLYKFPNSFVDGSYQSGKLLKDAEGNFEQTFKMDRPGFLMLNASGRTARLFFAPDHVLQWVSEYSDWTSPITIFGPGSEGNLFMMRYSAVFSETKTKAEVEEAILSLNCIQFERFADSLQNARFDYIKKYVNRYPLNETLSLYLSMDIMYYIAAFRYQYINHQIRRLMLGETVEINPEFFKFEKDLTPCNDYISNNPNYWMYLDEYIKYKTHSEYFRNNARYMDINDVLLFNQKAFFYVENFFEGSVKNTLLSRILYNFLSQKDLNELSPALQNLYQHYMLSEVSDAQKSLVTVRYESLRLKTK